MSRNTSGRYRLPEADTFLFVMFLVLHGLIHAAGLAYLGGPLWPVCGALFILAAWLLYRKNPKWLVVFVIAFVLSEILIILSWSQARWGFWLNIILFVFAAGKAAAARFDFQTRHLIDRLFNNLYNESLSTVTTEKVEGLCEPVKKWLYRTGILNNQAPFLVHVKQEGRLRLRPGGRWFSFDAEQYTLPAALSFIWHVRVKLNALMWLRGRDMLSGKKAGMLIKLAGLFSIVDQKNSRDLRMAALTRVFAEMAWCPALALHKNISWSGINEQVAEATLEQDGLLITGKFHFDPAGDLCKFSALRSYTSGENETLRHWVVEMNHYHDYHGLRLPSHYIITWKLPYRDFTWMEFTLNKLDYDKPFLFRKKYNTEYFASRSRPAPASLT